MFMHMHLLQFYTLLTLSYYIYITWPEEVPSRVGWYQIFIEGESMI